MNEELDNLLDSDQSGPKQLPQMLNVLTILTFIGSGLSLLSSLWSFATLSKTRETIELAREAQAEMAEEIDSPFANSMMEGGMKMLEHAPTLYTIGAIVAILCIIGALQMRKLKKSGYYIYVAACLIGVVAPLIVIGGGLLGGISAIVASVFSILFIILYGVNLKHMN